MIDDFFKSKRTWSKYKDFILGYYLEPYIPKVARLKRPILIVDCFAGCGRFDDGEPGSPLIIAPIIKKWRDKGVNVRGEFIEALPGNFQRLKDALFDSSDFATALFGNFEDHLDELAEKAKQNTVFLYVDPYTVKGLVFERMNSVYEQIRKSSASVELLLNLNVATFMRWALAAFKRHDQLPEEATNSDADYQADDPMESIEMSTLDAIAGGDYWRPIAGDATRSFLEKIGAFTTEYRKLLASSFTFAASCEIKSKYEHQVPKYVLIYGTRHPDGIEIMNDAMGKARLDSLGSQFRKGTLFDLTPNEEMPDHGALAEDLIAIVEEQGSPSRKELRNRAIWRHFGRFQTADINAAIGELLKNGVLFSSTGKSRINDGVQLSCVPFDDGPAQ